MYILELLDRAGSIITILAFILLWYQISRLKKITPKEEEWARSVKTLSKQFDDFGTDIKKGKFGDGKQVKEIGAVIDNLNQSVEALWQSMKKALKLTGK